MQKRILLILVYFDWEQPTVSHYSNWVYWLNVRIWHKTWCIHLQRVRINWAYKGKNTPGNQFKVANIVPKVQKFMSITAVNEPVHRIWRIHKHSQKNIMVIELIFVTITLPYPFQIMCYSSRSQMYWHRALQLLSEGFALGSRGDVRMWRVVYGYSSGSGLPEIW